ncbi:GNAT family N-acetyltransferase [Desulfoluna sp.]|uniref:GNAT family N-acetyltransferase n=1 Tax=Desulfoluna sp. TaxID=2045199 RepID=UPI0026136C1E|nr:GNAT family N-acetyltransferase [Desulfoluna sp.]
MIRLERVTDIERLGCFSRLCVEAFPVDERRPEAEYAGLLADPRYCLEMSLDENRCVGFFSSWDLTGFTYIEHFAVEHTCRGQGVGSAALRAFVAEHAGTVILEVEPPRVSVDAVRRIAFYERLGFLYNPVHHVQPPYAQGLQPVVLHLMSFPDPVTDYAAVRHELYTHVYDLSEAPM